MKITAIEFENFKGFVKLPTTPLSPTINLFIGSNNSGKTTILSAIFELQRRSFSPSDITIGQSSGFTKIYFEGLFPPLLVNKAINSIYFDLANSNRTFFNSDGTVGAHFGVIPSQEPQNLIYPYLSKRKTQTYADAINENTANAVTGNLSNLYAKIDRLVTPQYKPFNANYIDACNSILGFQISTIAKGNGKHAAYYVHNSEHISLSAMGEGVANILGLVTDLCVAENRIFLIEEPENDIHPKALKTLLKLIIEKSKTNQFFISTHSNIVMKYLGTEASSKIFYINSEIGLDNTRPLLHTSRLKEVSNDPEERRTVLEDLGYDFFDFDLWSAWLFLEESSAEIIIKNYLIPWFVKPLGNKIRTFSVGGSSQLLPKFEDFDRLFVFLHLESTYKNRVWVMIDGGDEEKAIIEKMQGKYSKTGWKTENFIQLDKHDFEQYFPTRFLDNVTAVLSIPDKIKKREQKKQLLNEVLEWIKSDEGKAKEEFEKSAHEVIDKLKSINKSLQKE
jgi:AAA15 family ATPase/GTPase